LGIAPLPNQRFAFTASQGGALARPPLAIPPAPGYAALRVRWVARFGRGRQNSALRASNRLPSFFMPTLRYSPT